MRTTLRRIVPLLVGLTVFGGCFAASFVSALHDPEPHGLPIGVTGPPALAQQLRTAAAAHGDPLDVTTYADPLRAEAAVRHHDVDGALVLQPPRATAYIAGAAGAAPTAVITAAFRAAARHAQVPLAVHDVAPLPKGDPEGISVVFLAISVLLPSLIFAIGLILRAPDAPVGVALAACVAFALLIGTLNTWIADGATGALVGSPWALAGMATLASLAMTTTTVAARRLLGLPGIGVAALVLVVYGFPASGMAVGSSFTPAFFRHIGQDLPAGAAMDGFRDAVYFSAGGRQAWILAAWIAGAVLVAVAATAAGARRGRRPEHHRTRPSLAT